jgi:hypothetical protein
MFSRALLLLAAAAVLLVAQRPGGPPAKKGQPRYGPAAFVKKEGMTFAKGDAITVTGSKVPYDSAEAILAREVKKGEKTLVLRNQKGVPLRSRGRWRT